MAYYETDIISSPMTYKEGVEWVAALRSGKYKQGIGKLKDEASGCYCCLGVEREVHPEQCKTVFHTGKLASIKDEILRLSRWIQADLVNFNDNHKKSFDEIADEIEQHILPQLIFADALRSIGWGV